MNTHHRNVRSAVLVGAALAVAGCVMSATVVERPAAAATRPLSAKATTKPKATAKPKVTKPKSKATRPATPTTRRAITTTSPSRLATTTSSTVVRDPEVTRLLAGYEKYFTAFVAAAREPQRAEQLLPSGMTGDALARMLEIRRLDAAEGLFWDGTRKSIVSGPRVESIGETTATLRDCRSVGGVLRRKATGEVVAGTTEPDVDDMRVTFVRIGDAWVVTATERFNEVEGRSQCVPGLPSP